MNVILLLDYKQILGDPGIVVHVTQDAWAGRLQFMWSEKGTLKCLSGSIESGSWLSIKLQQLSSVYQTIIKVILV